MSTPGFGFRVVAGEFAACRLPADAPLPGWAQGSRFCSVTRTDDELSVLCEAERVPSGVTIERGWRLLQVVGPLPFDAVGIMVAFVSPLAQAGVPVLTLATYDTDYVLVPGAKLSMALMALQRAGHHLADTPDSGEV